MGVTIIRNSSDAPSDTEPFDAVASDRLTIRDMTVIAGGSDRNTSDALDFDGGDDIVIERVAVADSRGRGIVFDGKDDPAVTGGTAERNVIRDCVITNVPEDGIQLLAASNNTIENCTITNAGGEGIRLHRSSSTAFQPNKPSNDNVVSGNTIQGSTGNGIAVTGADRNRITGNNITNSGLDGVLVFTPTSALACDNNIVEFNTASGNQWGLSIANSACYRTVVRDNTLTSNSLGAIDDNGTNTIYGTGTDPNAPSAPTNLAAPSVQANQVQLQWTAATDDVGVTGYFVLRDGIQIDEIGAVETYTDTTVDADTIYQYEVEARDAAGNISPPSNAITVTTSTRDPALETCASSTGSGYTVDICIDDPISGAAAVGDTNVAATVTVTGTDPGVQRVIFYLDAQYLLTDYEAPYTFVLPSDVFVDGLHYIEVEALMRDGFVTPNQAWVSADFTNGVTVPPPAPTTFTPTPGTTPAPGAPLVVVATGDGASGQAASDDVANAAVAMNPNMFLYLGDVYEKGTYTEFKNWYGEGARFGALASITNPILGNHERESGLWPGYDYYWGTPPPDYSFDSNGWHFIGMNLQLDGPQPSQTAWLAADLAANTADCTIAYFHYPVLSVGPQGDTPALFSTWQQLVDAGVDIVLTAHDHNYQRWLPMDRDLNADPNGATHFVVGSGGHGIQGFVGTDPRLAYGADTTPAAYGSLKLNLNADGAGYSYINTAGAVLDSGSLDCTPLTPDVTPPSVPDGVNAVGASASSIDVTWTASVDDVGVDAYEVFRDGSSVALVGGGTTSYTDSDLQPATTYAYTIEAVDAAGNRSGQSSPPKPGTTLDPEPQATFDASADSYVDGVNVSSNFGTSTDLRVDGSPDLRSYVKFSVAGITGPVASATLRVHANSTHSTGFEVQETTSGWGETTIAYTNAPGFGPSLGTSGPTTGGAYVEIDVTGYVTGNGDISFALTALNNTNLRLASRETSNPPQLVITQDVSGNTPPTADDVAMSTDEDVAGVWIPVVGDVDPDTLTCSISSAPANGSATVASDCSSGTYTPDPEFNGADSFVYEVSDGSATDTGVVSVTVNPINDAPVADAQSVTATQDDTATIVLTGSDIDGDCPLMFAIAAPPSNGTLGTITNQQCTNGTASAEVVYTPKGGYTGPDSFTFTVADPSTAVSAPATVDITVDAPQTSFTFDASADSYVSGQSTGNNYGTSSQLRVDGSPDLRSYVKFSVAGITGPVASATLRVHANSTHSTGF
ncbi:MAG: DNRLRE domain-containing protein, partial [Acidimicrobiia bacterium]|nr:DNRLRE domain-containing protein [Acidimicrobiia bacterium]